MAKALILYPSTDSYGRFSIPISIISGLLKTHGHEVDLFDTTFYETKGLFQTSQTYSQNATSTELLQFQPCDLKPFGVTKENVDVLESFREKIEQFNPDLILFSFMGSQLTSVDQYEMYDRSIELIKKSQINREGRLFLAGGFKPTLKIEECVQDGIVDYFFQGECEPSFLEFADRFDRGEDLTEIDSICYLKDGELQINKLADPPNLNELPYADFDIYEDRMFVRPFHGRAVRGIDYELSRGCRFFCTFCMEEKVKTLYKGDEDKYFRLKTIDRVIDEMKYLKERYSLDMVKFHDQDFLDIPEDYLDDLAERWTQEVKLSFCVETTLVRITDRKLKAMKKMNLLSMSIGLESGNENIRKNVMAKPTPSNDKIIALFDKIHENGLDYHTYNLIGIPYETKENIFETIRLNKRAKIRSASVNFYVPYEGTKLKELCLEKGWLKDDHESNYSLKESSALQMPQITDEELKHMMQYFHYYMNTPEFLWPIVNLFGEKDFFCRFLQTIFKNTLQVKLKIKASFIEPSKLHPM
jgi:anaerobic magnesium-protoporphyrin IX monomethyl ester cyclase